MKRSGKYCVGGHVFGVAVEAPWRFRELTEEEKRSAERLRRGEDLGVKPVPADRPEQIEENARLSGRVRSTRSRYELDWTQYAPFEVGEECEPLFALTVREKAPQWLSDRSGWVRVVGVEDALPYYFGYVYGDRVIYEYFPAEGICAGQFVMSAEGREGDYYPQEGTGPLTAVTQISTSLMIMYTFATAGLGTLLLHASVVRHHGEANLFFGVSGTGKSTHSRLWLQSVPDCDLMNDDNPIVRLSAAGRSEVYGSPWSGKTICYRNVSAPVRALVRLEQAPVNRIRRLEPLEAYASILAAASTVRWRRDIMDRLIPDIECLAMSASAWNLRCRPDEEAVLLCYQSIES